MDKWCFKWDSRFGGVVSYLREELHYPVDLDSCVTNAPRGPQWLYFDSKVKACKLMIPCSAECRHYTLVGGSPQFRKADVFDLPAFEVEACSAQYIPPHLGLLDEPEYNYEKSQCYKCHKELTNDLPATALLFCEDCAPKREEPDKVVEDIVDKKTGVKYRYCYDSAFEDQIVEKVLNRMSLHQEDGSDLVVVKNPHIEPLEVEPMTWGGKPMDDNFGVSNKINEIIKCLNGDTDGNVNARSGD